MTDLILVRHSLPDIVPALPASQWRLSVEGRRRCQALADTLAAYAPDAIVCSVEPKAVETAQIVAQRLGQTFTIVEGLHEHERPFVDRLFDRRQFEAQVAGFFQRPHDLVMGAETADQAHARFAGAVNRTVTEHPGKTVAIVTHGTVITLFVARAVGLPPFPFWRQLGLPACAVLPLPTMDAVAVVNVESR